MFVFCSFQVIHQPPVGGKELIPLSGAQLAGFRLHPGPLPEQYRTANLQALKKKKHKKHRGSEVGPTSGGGPAGSGGGSAPGVVGSGLTGSVSGGPLGPGVPGGSTVSSASQGESAFNAEAEKKHKRTKKHDEERKKKKKDKKKKKTRHSPEPPGGGPHTPTLAPNTPTGTSMVNRVTI